MHPVVRREVVEKTTASISKLSTNTHVKRLLAGAIITSGTVT